MVFFEDEFSERFFVGGAVFFGKELEELVGLKERYI